VVYCLGSCGLAPVATVDGGAVGKLAPERMAAIVQKLE
jgi:NADH:ubiquinone oxidoreductase subunit E